MFVLQRPASYDPLLPVSGEATGEQQMQFEGQYGEIHDTALLQVRQVSDALKGPATPWSRALIHKPVVPHLPKKLPAFDEVHYTWSSTYDRPHLRPQKKSPTSTQEHDPNMYCTV
jgi:hypothetical protein